MVVTLGNELGLEILRALKIPNQGVRGIDIKIYVNAVATITIERMIYQEAVDNLVTVFDKYELVSKV